MEKIINENNKRTAGRPRNIIRITQDQHRARARKYAYNKKIRINLPLIKLVETIVQDSRGIVNIKYTGVNDLGKLKMHSELLKFIITKLKPNSEIIRSQFI